MRGCVSSQKGWRSRPVVSRSGRAPSLPRSRTKRSDVSRSSMNTAVRPSALTVSDRGRALWAIASRRQCGGGPTSGRAGTGMPSRSSLPIQIRSSASGSGTRHSLLHPGERLRHQGADRGQVVAALLDEDGRKRQGAERAAGRSIGRGRDVQRALRVAGGGGDAAGELEAAGGATGGGAPPPAAPRADPVDGFEPCVVAAARRERLVAVAAFAVAGAGL